MNPIERIISLFTPYDCLICNQEGEILCKECAELLPRQTEVCFICGRVSANCKTCPQCVSRNKPQHVWSSFVYKGNVKAIVKSYKFEGARALARIMAMQMDGSLPYFAQSPIITFVPTAPNRHRQRGFDHARLLAKELAKLRKWQFAELLVRRSKVRQLGAKREIRQKQLKDAFWSVERQITKGAHVLLIDDVVTTGATLEACSKQLIKAGVAQVDALTFARTPKSK